MFQQLLFAISVFVFLIFTPCSAFAENEIIRNKTVRNKNITAGNRLAVLKSGKTQNSNILDGGLEDVFHGGISQNAVIRKGGKLLLAGGKSFGAVIHDGGLMEVREYQKKSSYAANTRVSSGGRMNVYNRSLAEKITVESGGLLRVYFPKSLISDVTVLPGGLLHVWKHGTAQNVNVAPGGLLELREESPVLKGKIRISGQLKASFDHKPDVRQAKIIIDLSKRKISDDYAIINLDYLGKTDICIEVSENQAPGLYRLASQAGKSKQSLKLAIGGQYQQLILQKPISYAGKYYTLSHDSENNLELQISSKTF